MPTLVRSAPSASACRIAAAFLAEWSIGALLRLGMRTRLGGVERLAGGPIVFDGAIDNRADLVGPQ